MALTKKGKCFYHRKKVLNMWLLVLILSIKLQMPTWYWILFTIFTLIKPILSLINLYLEDEIKKGIKDLSNNK